MVKAEEVLLSRLRSAWFLPLYGESYLHMTRTAIKKSFHWSPAGAVWMGDVSLEKKIPSKSAGHSVACLAFGPLLFCPLDYRFDKEECFPERN